jgi:hypothetical protein
MSLRPLVFFQMARLLRWPAIAVAAVATVLIQLHFRNQSPTSNASSRMEFQCKMQLQRAVAGFDSLLNFSTAFTSDGEDAQLVHRILSCNLRLDDKAGRCGLERVSWPTFAAAVVAIELEQLKQEAFSGLQSSRSQLLQRAHSLFYRLHKRDSTFSQEFSVCLPEFGTTELVDDSIATAARFINHLANLYPVRHVSKDVKVVVVGGGPVGLLSAIAAQLTGAAVTVIEKRLQYKRSVWYSYPCLPLLCRSSRVNRPMSVRVAGLTSPTAPLLRMGRRCCN